ncbi:MAG: sterol desaturase family protein [Bacteroidia bacterium]|nr:sterol desaturase family protein [Bacteroidia bacterium]
MISLLAGIALFLFVVIAMEGWAWISHKYLLHGPLWFLHKTHHEPQDTWWEWNDLVALLYGITSSTLIVLGIGQLSWHFYVGAGIAAYGMLYFLFHDVIIHRRVKLKYHFSSSYINRLIRAHKIHHKHLGKHQSEAFGFLYAPKKYEVKKRTT